MEGLSEELRRLRELVAELETEAASYGDQEQQLSELERDLRVKRRLYEDLLERRVKAQVTGSLGRFERADRVKVIDAPFTPSAPANPAFVLYIFAGLLAGIALGAGLATIIELLDTTVRQSEKLETLTGVPVLTRVPALRPSGVEGVTPKIGAFPKVAHGFR